MGSQYFGLEEQNLEDELPSRKPSRVLFGDSLVLGFSSQPTTAITDVNVKAGEECHHLVSQNPSLGTPESEDGTDEEDTNALRVTTTNNSKSSTAPTLTVYAEDDDVERMLSDLIQDDHDYSINHQSQHETNLDLGFDFDAFKIEKEIDAVQFKSKPKHFFILSSAGKPIYSMHGTDDIVTNYMGVISTILSFFEENDDEIKSVSIGDSLITFFNRAPIILVAVSSSPQESEQQLTSQLNLLYFYLLSILTKPFITKVFANRENYDLRKVLNKTDLNNLDNLCMKICYNEQNFLIGGLECLKLPKRIRTKLNTILINGKKASQDLLYGLIVVPNGKLISCLRPKKHSLHTIDLQILFELAFNNTFKNDINNESSSEEFWVPICLPKFNPNGFLYCFINFINLNNISGLKDDVESSGKEPGNGFAVMLISANKNSFFDMQKISKDIVNELIQEKIHHYIKQAISSGGISIKADIQSPLIRHFIYKSKQHLQYVMSDFDEFESLPNSKHQLMHLYSLLYASLNNDSNENPTEKKITYLKWKNDNTSITGMGWCNANFEIYCISSGIVRKDILMKGCKKIVHWCQKNEERLFVCGGAVF